MKKLYEILFFTGLLCILSCDPEEENVNPDLLFDFARINQPSVNLGVPLVVENAITNEEASCDNCATKSAGANARSIRVQYRPDLNSPWVDAQLKDQNGNITYELVVPVPEIQPGKKHTKSEGYSFATPGYYRYLLLADRDQVVLERIETNNDTDSNDGTVGKGMAAPRFKLTLQVLDHTGMVKPNYDPSVPVTVIYLGEL